jgi:hypothetical protein
VSSENSENSSSTELPARHTIRLPRFIIGRPVGAGDVVKRITSAVGVKPCSACKHRAAHLNEWLTLKPAGDREGSL